VAPGDELSGLGSKTDRPHVNVAVELSRLQLTPTEGFVLSRIDGRASYDEICRVSSLGREETLAILRKLKADKVILGPGEPAASSVPPMGRNPTATRAASLWREPKTPAPVMVTDEMLRQAREKTSGKAAQATAEPGSALERLDDGGPVDPGDLIDGHDLPLDTKKRIVRLHRRLRRLAPHELLGVAEDADPGTVKRAFTAASKELHPDRYFGKDLGGFREKLAQIFARFTEAMQEMEKARKAKR
jgi:DnaJ-domain-containing protein 1